MIVKLIEKDEIILLEEVINYNSQKRDSNLYLTNLKIIIENKGLFKKNVIVYLADIKKYRNKLMLEQKEDVVFLQSANYDLVIDFEDKAKAKKFASIIKKQLGNSKLDKAKELCKKIDPEKVMDGVKVATSIAAFGSEVINKMNEKKNK
jgi:hypothetical protein